LVAGPCSRRSERVSEEEIIGDLKPRCRFCPVTLIPESDYSQLWMSPYIAIKRMQTISEKYGIQRARTDGRFKKEREAWTTAVFALALSMINGESWWVEIETKENTPDARLRRLEQSSGNNVIQTRSCEVVDWEENVDDVMEVIRKKCRRAYPGHYILLLNVRNSGKVLDFDHLIQQMKAIQSPFLEVWLIAFAEPRLLKVVRVAPSAFAIDLNLTVAMPEAMKQHPFMKPLPTEFGLN
jgi:hypothetical protein